MSEAERILRDRERRESQERQASSNQAAAEKATLQRQQLSEATSLIRKVLSLLAQQGYPGMTGLTIEKPRLGSMLGYRHVRMGAWHIGGYSYVLRGDDLTADIYLLSDGKLVFTGGIGGNTAHSLGDELSMVHLYSVLTGLRRLHQDLQR